MGDPNALNYAASRPSRARELKPNILRLDPDPSMSRPSRARELKRRLCCHDD